MNSPSNLREIAEPLMTLTGTSIAAMARKTGYPRSNLSAWFSGKPNAISEARQIAVCEKLGWQYDRLEGGIVHRWSVSSLEEVRLAARMLERFFPGTRPHRVIKAIGNAGDLGALVCGQTPEKQLACVQIRFVQGRIGDLPAVELLWEDTEVLMPGGEYAVKIREFKAWWSKASPSDLTIQGLLESLDGESKEIVAAALGLAGRTEQPPMGFEAASEAQDDFQWQKLLEILRRSGMSPAEICRKLSLTAVI